MAATWQDTRIIPSTASWRRRNSLSPSFRGDAKHRTRNLEVPGSLRAPERRADSSRRRALLPLAAGDLRRCDHGLRAAFDAELLQDRRDMRLDGCLGDP